MAAFCACCGAEITLKAERCSVCGTPQHGLLKADVLFPDEAAASAEDNQNPRLLGGPFCRTD